MTTAESPLASREGFGSSPSRKRRKDFGTRISAHSRFAARADSPRPFFSLARQGKVPLMVSGSSIASRAASPESGTCATRQQQPLLPGTDVAHPEAPALTPPLTPPLTGAGKYASLLDLSPLRIRKGLVRKTQNCGSEARMLLKTKDSDE